MRTHKKPKRLISAFRPLKIVEIDILEPFQRSPKGMSIVLSFLTLLKTDNGNIIALDHRLGGTQIVFE